MAKFYRLTSTLTSTHIESYDNNSIMYPHSNPPYSSRSACRPSTSAIVHPNGTALSTQSSVATRNLNSEIANLTCSTFGINANDVFKSQSNTREIKKTDNSIVGYRILSMMEARVI